MLADIFFSFRHMEHKKISLAFVKCGYLWVLTKRTRKIDDTLLFQL